MDFDGILFFPVTPFDAEGRIDDDLLREHVSTTLGHSPGGVFPACGTGEFHALSAEEAGQVVRVATETVAGRVPVVAGTGGPLGHATAVASAAADAGADALLVLPPYLVGGPQAGLAAYVEAVAAASPLPVIIYHRGSAQYAVDTVRLLARNPQAVEEREVVAALLGDRSHDLLCEPHVADAVLEADDLRVAGQQADGVDRILSAAAVVDDDGQRGCRSDRLDIGGEPRLRAADEVGRQHEQRVRSRVGG